jgi:hypothetical protein
MILVNILLGGYLSRSLGRSKDDVTEIMKVFLVEYLLSDFIRRVFSVAGDHRFETRVMSIHRTVVVISEGID